MGAQVAKPNPPSNNEAKANADLAMEALHLSADKFLADIRLGAATIDGLGYPLAGGKLTDQEVKILVQTEANVTSDHIKAVINGLFSQDWKAVAMAAADVLLPFLSGGTPKPSETAVNESWSKSFLIWECNSIMQYSIYMKKTNATSIGTTAQSGEMTVLACICRGVVAYESIDPQVIVFELSKSHADMEQAEFDKMMKMVEAQLEMATHLAMRKRQLLAGMSIPSLT